MTAADFWQRHVFVLLSSDAAYRGVHGGMVRRLREEGFPPVAIRIINAHPELVDDLYADLIAGQWRTWRYRLVDAVLALGPAVAMICRYDGAGGAAHELLAQRKGYQHPEQAAHGTLRRDFGAINSIVGLMHSSDGPPESEREAAVFGLTPECAAAGQDQAAEIDFRCQLTMPHAPEQRDFDQVLAAVRIRTVASIWDDLRSDARRGIREAFPRVGGMGGVGAGDRLAGLLDGQAAPGLLGVIRCEFEPQWRDRMRMGQAENVLRRHGVGLDRWERVVLESSLHFPPLRASRGAAS